jgi:hypothetical protein
LVLAFEYLSLLKSLATPICGPYDPCMTPSYGGLALEIVVPVFNEEAVLENSIRRLS